MVPGAKRKRVVLSFKQKLDIIRRLDEGENIAVLAAEYNVGKSSVIDIKMGKRKLLNYVSSLENAENINRRKTMKSAFNPKLDQAVLEWCTNMKKNGHALSGPLICEKALELNSSLGGSSYFKASGSWLQNFKSRHGLDISFISSEKPKRSYVSNSVQTVLAANSKDTSSTSKACLKGPLLPKSSQVKRKRIVLSLKQKLDIINRLGNGETASSLAKEYNVGLSSVYDIRMQQSTISNYVSSFANVDNMYERKMMRSASNVTLDQAVYSWYIDAIQTGQSVVTDAIIRDKALEFNKTMGGSSDFKASTGWLHNFKSRHGLFFNESSSENFSDVNILSEDIYLTSYENYDKANSLSFECNNASSSQSYDSFSLCNVKMSVSSDCDAFVKNLSVQSDFQSNDNSAVLRAFDTVLDWAKKQRELSSEDVVNLVKLRDLAKSKEMSVAFSSDDSEPIKRQIEKPPNEQRDESFSLEDMYEIGRCVEWINSNNYSKVALQFPDSMLNDATAVALKLDDVTNKQMFVLGDTSYGSCCVDEISAEHVSADAIIHFGHACLSPTKRLPVLYIFGKQVIQIQDVTEAFRKTFSDKKRPVVILFEVMYSYAIDVISEILKEYENLIVSRLDIPGEDSKSLIELEINENLIPITKCHRTIFIPSDTIIDNYDIFYIGSRTVTLTNFMLALKNCNFYTYNPALKLARAETLDVNKHLKRRYYYIEKAKDAKIIGILVGTLGASNYLTMIQHLKNLIKQAGKKYYTIVVGKLNGAKLANFAEIDIFVNVACVESSLIESREFFQSIVTPYELEIALNQARKWTGDYIADFSEILPGAMHYVAPSEYSEVESDVSLVTGKIRHTGLTSSADSEIISNTELISRSDMKVSAIHSQGAAGTLSLFRNRLAKVTVELLLEPSQNKEY